MKEGKMNEHFQQSTKVQTSWKNLENKIRNDLVEKAKLKKYENESHVLFVGDPQSGKTSLIQNLIENEMRADSSSQIKSKAKTNLKKISKPNPTMAFDYIYIRRQKPGTDALATSNEEICHIWELGDGLCHKDLINIPFFGKDMGRCRIIITLDLSKPENVLPSLQHFLETITLSFRRKSYTADANSPNQHER